MGDGRDNTVVGIYTRPCLSLPLLCPNETMLTDSLPPLRAGLSLARSPLAQPHRRIPLLRLPLSTASYPSTRVRMRHRCPRSQIRRGGRISRVIPPVLSGVRPLRSRIRGIGIAIRRGSATGTTASRGDDAHCVLLRCWGSVRGLEKKRGGRLTWISVGVWLLVGPVGRLRSVQKGRLSPCCSCCSRTGHTWFFARGRGECLVVHSRVGVPPAAKEEE